MRRIGGTCRDSAVDDIRVAVASDTALGIRDNGVHTAFIEQVRGLRRLGIQVAVNDLTVCRRAAVTFVHTLGPVGLTCLAAAGPRGVLHAHVTPETLVGSFRYERAWSRAAAMALRHIYTSTPLVLVGSEVVRDELTALGTEPSRLRHLPYGIDTSSFAKAEHTSDRRRRTVLGVGQLQPRKGLSEFVAAARVRPEDDFVWVGGRPFGPLTATNARFSRLLASPPPNVHLLGRLSPTALRETYARADAFFFPSRQENFGQVVLEAAAAGLPLVLSDLPAFREHFAANATVRARDDLAGALGEILEQPCRAAQASAAATELAARYTAHRTSEATVALAREYAGRIFT